jgi:hypothetical protein
MGVIAIALWRHRFRPPAFWTRVTIVFGLLALGPFIHVGGVNTFVPGPWALLRYLPVVGAARMPARFVAPAMMGFAVLFAVCLAHLTRAHGRKEGVVLAAVGAALAFELAPAPRTLHSSEIPGIYRTVAQDRRDIRILELPVGFRDGESSFGDFAAVSQFYQTFHGKRLVGGYLSRIGRQHVERQLRFGVVRGLVTMSEGREPTAAELGELVAQGASFARRARIGYVVIDRSRATPMLRKTAIQAFRLEKMADSGSFELYRVPARRAGRRSGGSGNRVLPAIAPLGR